MGDYADAATHVQPLLGGRTFGASAIVTTAQADAWIDQAERELIGTIAAGGGSTDYTADTTHAVLIIREWVSMFVAGKCRMAYASAAGDSDNDDGRQEVEDWRELLQAIRSNPIPYVQLLAQSASQSVAGIRSHADATIADDASFKMTEKF